MSKRRRRGFNNPMIRAAVAGTVIDPTEVYLEGMLAYTPVAGYDLSLSSKWQDSARTTPAAADGAVLGALDDLSGNGYHVIQAVTANKPLLKLNIQNGKPVSRHDGTDLLADTTFVDFGDTYTYYALGAYANNADASQGIFNVGTNAINTGFGQFHDTVSKGHTRDAGTNRNVSGSDIRTGAWKLHTLTNSGTLVSYWQNAVSVGTVAYTAPNPSTLTHLTIGAMDTIATFAFIGDFGCLWLFNTAHDVTTRTAIWTIINNFYAVY